MKKCRICKRAKELTEFYKEKGMKDGHRNDCKKCRDKERDHRRDLNRDAYNAYHVKYMKEHPRSKEQNEKNMSRVMKCRYGITLREYHHLLESQGGHCALCIKTGYKTKRLAIDHCHKTGAVRGILCDHCNVSLAVLENAEFLAKAQAYLAKYSSSLG